MKFNLVIGNQWREWVGEDEKMCTLGFSRAKMTKQKAKHKRMPMFTWVQRRRLNLKAVCCLETHLQTCTRYCTHKKANNETKPNVFGNSDGGSNTDGLFRAPNSADVVAMLTALHKSSVGEAHVYRDGGGWALGEHPPRPRCWHRGLLELGNLSAKVVVHLVTVAHLENASEKQHTQNAVVK